MGDLCQIASMCPKHDTPCVLPEARDNTSWPASLTRWTADPRPPHFTWVTAWPPQPVLQLLQGHRGHSWHSSTALCWAMRASTHQHRPFTQEIRVGPHTLYGRVSECLPAFFICILSHLNSMTMTLMIVTYIKNRWPSYKTWPSFQILIPPHPPFTYLY